VTVATLLKLALVPTAVWLASLAARRWGHSVSGYLGGFPMIGGPITLYLALDHGPEFAAGSALVTLAAIAGQAAHLLSFAWAGIRFGWLAGLAAGWAGDALVSVGVSRIASDPAMALALAVAGLLAAWMGLPRVRGQATLPAVPPVELWLRLVAAFALAAFILWGSGSFGPVVSGILLSMPITGSIMPPFTLALYGPDAIARLLRGFVVGLCGFAAFFFTVAVAVVPLGTAVSFALATLAALVAIFAVTHLK